MINEEEFESYCNLFDVASDKHDKEIMRKLGSWSVIDLKTENR